MKKFGAFVGFDHEYCKINNKIEGARVYNVMVLIINIPFLIFYSMEVYPSRARAEPSS